MKIRYLNRNKRVVNAILYIVHHTSSIQLFDRDRWIVIQTVAWVTRYRYGTLVSSAKVKIVALKAKEHKCTETEREGTNVSELKFSKKDIMTMMKYYNRATECAAYELDDNTEQFQM